MATNTPGVSGLSPDAERALAWFREHYYGGRAPVYSGLEIARGLFAREQGPAPGSTFDPSAWGRVNLLLQELEQRGLVRKGRLPQGDFGWQLETQSSPPSQ